MLSPAEAIARDPAAAQALLKQLQEDERHAEKLAYDWDGFLARPNQRIPKSSNWSIWLALAGRGWGKTRCGAAFTRWCKDRYPVGVLVARTAAELRDYMIEGESGVLQTSPPWDRPLYEPGKKRLTWKNGAVAILRSADAPESLRGANSYWFWADEAATWKMSPVRKGEPQLPTREPDAWSNLMMGWRLGDRPVGFVSTTPRPLKWLRNLRARPDTSLSAGSTLENAGNLAKQFQQNVIDRYAGTALEQQEIHGRILDEIPNALWNYEVFQNHRRISIDRRSLARIVIGIDPAGTANAASDLTGLVAVGRSIDGRAYVLDDWSGQYKAEVWARRAAELYDKWEADAVVAEVNNGGDMVAATLKAYGASRLPIREVRASRGKHVRAEPVSALYSQGKVSHVSGIKPDGDPDHEQFAELEQQGREMTRDGWMGDGSPDRLEAMIWAMYDLFKLSEPTKRGGLLFSS